MRRAAPALFSLLLVGCTTVIPQATPAGPTAAPADDTPAPATAPPTEEPAASPTTTPIGIAGLRESVVRIEAEGTFYEPLAGQVETISGGSGFIIDPEGIVVTNNHVVTGGSVFRVYFDDSTTDFTRAQLLGQSECSDLAVLQLLGGGDFQSLSWYEGPVEAGLRVQAAGYPETAYSLREGQVTTRPTSLATQWAAVDSVIEHTSEILGGFSGGPLVTDPGAEVVAVDYARGLDEPRSYAIAASQARDIVEELSAGRDVYSIGINGQAVEGYGIWVASVKPGSPADRAVIKPGDLIYELGSLDVGQDGTMQRYCDVLIGHASGSPLDVKWADWDQGVCYSAQLNTSDRPAIEERCPEGLFPEPTPPPGGGMDTVMIHSSVRSTCVETTPWQGAVASVACTPSAGADRLYFDRFPDAAAMNEYVDNQVEIFDLEFEGRCEEGPREDTWSLDDVQRGRLLCFDNGGAVWFQYTYDDYNILITAIRDDGDFAGLYEWWTNAPESILEE